MSFGGGSCIISPAGCIGELLMPFNGCPYSVTWDQCPSGKETRNGWCILEVTCQRAETRRDQQTWEWDVSAGRGNLFGFGLLSPYSAFKNESRWLSLTHNDMARRGHWGKNLIFFSLCSAIESIPGLIEWLLGCTAEEEVICYAFFMWNSFCKQNSSRRAPITEKCELN